MVKNEAPHVLKLGNKITTRGERVKNRFGSRGRDLTVGFHANVQTLLIAAELANISGGRRNLTVTIPTTLVLLHVPLLYRSSKKALKSEK